MLPLYELYRAKKRSISWSELFSFWRLLLYIGLILPGFIIMYYRFKIMNFEGPIFTSNDNPAAFADNFFTRVRFLISQPDKQ